MLARDTKRKIRFWDLTHMRMLLTFLGACQCGFPGGGEINAELDQAVKGSSCRSKSLLFYRMIPFPIFSTVIFCEETAVFWFPGGLLKSKTGKAPKLVTQESLLLKTPDDKMHFGQSLLAQICASICVRLIFPHPRNLRTKGHTATMVSSQGNLPPKAGKGCGQTKRATHGNLGELVQPKKKKVPKKNGVW